MAFLDRLQQQFDGGKTFRFGQVDPFQDVGSWVGTGSPSLDLQLGTFGYPTGVIEIRGVSQSGKTTMSLQAMKTAIESMGERAVVSILSSERRDNLAYAAQMGVPVNQIILHRIKTIEDVKNKIFQTIRKAEAQLTAFFVEEGKDAKVKKDELEDYVAKRRSEFGQLHFFFIWDALGQTVSAQELQKAEDNADKDETGMAALASASRALPNMLRSIKALEDDHNLTLMIINRAYDKIDGTPGKKSYGGNAIELFPTMRLELTRIQGIKVGDEEVGQVSEVKVIKSDFGSPKQSFKIEIGYGLGIILNQDDIDFGIECGVLEKFGQGGAIFTMGKKEMLKWKTRRELYQLYTDRDPNLKILVKLLTSKAHARVKKERDDKLAKLLKEAVK